MVIAIKYTLFLSTKTHKKSVFVTAKSKPILAGVRLRNYIREQITELVAIVWPLRRLAESNRNTLSLPLYVHALSLQRYDIDTKLVAKQRGLYSRWIVR